MIVYKIMNEETGLFDRGLPDRSLFDKCGKSFSKISFARNRLNCTKEDIIYARNHDRKFSPLYKMDFSNLIIVECKVTTKVLRKIHD